MPFPLGMYYFKSLFSVSSEDLTDTYVGLSFSQIFRTFNTYLVLEHVENTHSGVASLMYLLSHI